MPVIISPDIESAYRKINLRQDGRRAVGGKKHRTAAFHIVLDAFQPDPEPREPAERPAMQAVINDFLDVGRIENRHHRIDKRILALMAGGRAFAGMIIAQQCQNTAKFGAARQVAMAEHVTAAIHARPLAIPKREHAIFATFAPHGCLLRPPDGGGCQIFVQPWLEHDPGRLQRHFG